MQRALRMLLFLLGSAGLSIPANAQVNPIPVTGFNNDAIAESGPSSLATTSLQVDGGSSNKVMYTNAFKTFAGISGGGLPDDGIIVNGGDTYQLSDYSANNALYVYRNEVKGISLVTPASYSRVKILAFSTEGASILNVRFVFTDGSFTDYFTNYSLPDWFTGSPNMVLQGFGRCSRVAIAPWGADAFPASPSMYAIDVPLNCGDKSKLLQSVFFGNFSTFPNNAPFPNTVVLGLSGSVTVPPVITSVVTPCDCAGPNGSIALTVTGNAAPYSYLWPTTIPPQSGATATQLPPGPYTCTVTDINNCQHFYTATVPMVVNSSITATADPQTVCAGEPVTLTANVISGVFQLFGWTGSTTPGAPFIPGQTITVNPTATTIYRVVGQRTSFGWWDPCITQAFVTVTVNPLPAAPTSNGVSVCSGSSGVLQVQNPQGGYTYNWYSSATSATALGSGTSFTTPALTAPTVYFVEAVNGTNCRSSTRTGVIVLITALPAAPNVNGITVCPGDNAVLSVINPQPAPITYKWYNVSSGGTALATAPTYSLTNINAATTYYVEAVTGGLCASSTRTAATVSLHTQLSAPAVTVTNTTFNSLTFSWSPIAGATGYEASTDGGIIFQAPSSGPLGTTHTINGLAGNTTVAIRVRALAAQTCQTSNLSNLVSGTTLSSKEIFVPNVFTPNGDGKNDVLLVYGNYIASMQLRIFNQWGQMIFVSENINTGWNGVYNGQQQPVGVYTYILKVVLRDGTVVNKKGAINLIR